MDTRRYIYQYSCLSCVFRVASWTGVVMCCILTTSITQVEFYSIWSLSNGNKRLFTPEKNSLGLVSLCCLLKIKLLRKNIVDVATKPHPSHPELNFIPFYITKCVFKWIQEVILICKITPTLFLCVAYKPPLSPGTELNFIQFSYFIVDTRGNMHMENALTLNYYNICQT